ncbi:MAG: PhoH family protein [Myxococcota bacterium]|nr:PhoH family protein [Myxococcota bacterium]
MKSSGNHLQNHPVHCLELTEPQALRELVGELGHHLKIVGKNAGVDVSQRGTQILVRGPENACAQAIGVLEQLYALANAGHPLGPADVDQATRLLISEPDTVLLELFTDVLQVGSRGKKVHPRTPRQRTYIKAIRNHDIVFGTGPAGTGKTYLAMAMALSALSRDTCRRIVLCRPAVEAGENLGFLPGDLSEKVDPYLRPLHDALYDLLTFDRATRLVEKGIIEVAPLAFMRGRTLSDSFIILDEAQNTTPLQMKMFLTRMGLQSKLVITGDVTQVDLPPGQTSGLLHALGILRSVPGIATVEFLDTDIVRHPLVTEVVRAYEQHARSQSGRDSNHV